MKDETLVWILKNQSALLRDFETLRLIVVHNMGIQPPGHGVKKWEAFATGGDKWHVAKTIHAAVRKAAKGQHE